MRVALDAAPLALSSGGLRRYAAELSRALGETFPDDEFAFVRPAPASWIDRRWWLLGLNRELARMHADVFHGTNFETPYVPLRPSVVTIHDLSPWRDASWHAGAARVRGRAPAVLRLGLATMVITVSEAVRREVIGHFRLHPSRVVAVPLAPATGLRRVEAPPGVPYFLYLGTVEPRKNVPAIIEAWRRVRRDVPAELVIAGRFREDAPVIAAEPGLRILGEVPEDRLAPLYSSAIAVLYPSLYEGFGLPVIEAMQCGAMVIASRDAALLEVSGGAAVHACARDVSAWAEAMRAAATQPDWASAWRDRAAVRAKDFSWTATARLTREVYEEAIRRHAA